MTGCAATAAASTLTNLNTVFIIMMENHSWSDIFGNTNAPYINGVLLPMASYCQQYLAFPPLGGSLPNYIWLEGGTNFGILNDLDPYENNCQTPFNVQYTTNHLVTYLNSAGISWKAYMEDTPTNIIELSDYAKFAVRHNPFAYFADIIGTNHEPITCTATNPYGVAHIRPYNELPGDLASNTMARYNFITPNLCHDMHDSCLPLTNVVLQGDTWLASEIPRLLSSEAYQSNGVIFITWDEALPTNAPMGMIVISPLAKGGGYRNTIHYTHSSTIRTVQEIFGVTPWLGDAANATDLIDLFNLSDSLTRPEFTRVARGTDGVVRVTVGGAVPGSTNLVQAADDLIHWTSLSTNVADTTTFFIVTDTAATNRTSRFYRAFEYGP